MQYEDKLVELLAAAYVRVRWSQMKGRMPYDVFQHRLKVAARKPTIPEALDKLCHGLSLQSVSVPPELVEDLDVHREEVLHMMRTRSVLLTLKAAQKA